MVALTAVTWAAPALAPAPLAAQRYDVLADRATYSDPHQYRVGITDLLVNGVPVIRNGGLTGEKPGRWIRGPVRRPVS